MGQVIYIRVTNANHAWLKEQAAKPRVSITRIVDDMITAAREGGYEIEPARLQARLVRKGETDATQAPRDRSDDNGSR